MTDYSTKRFTSLVLLLLVTTTAGTWCKKDVQSTYSENLATHRRQFKVVKSVINESAQTEYKKKPVHITPTHSIIDQLDHLLACKKAVNEQVKYVQGYTIQVYAGGSRKEAFKISNKLYTHYPAIAPEITYDLPHYTVRLGKFLDMLEAYSAYAAIRKRIPQAIIRPIYFVNKPHVFINKQSAGKCNAVSSMPPTNEHHQNEQE